MSPHPNHARALQILAKLEQAGFEARLVGGCVRDRLLGLSPQDYDIASTATTDEVMKLFGKQAKPTGIEYGTVTLVIKGAPFEVTTLRSDNNCDGRHASVSFGGSFESDAARRDFTINALSEDIHGTVHDSCDGKKHLAQRKLVFVGDPQKRIQEDYLRILRFFRFQARLGFQADPEALKAIQSNVSGVARLSPERIYKELWALLTCPDIKTVLTQMLEADVFPVALPGVFPARLSKDQQTQFIELADMLSQTDPAWLPIVRLAVLHTPQLGYNTAHANSDVLYERWKELRFPKRVARAIHFLAGSLSDIPRLRTQADRLLFIEKINDHEPTFFEKAVIPFVKAVSEKDPTLAVATTALEKTFADQGYRLKMDFPLTGHDCSTIGLQGFQVGDALKTLRREFLDGLWKTRTEGLKRLKTLHAGSTKA